MNQTLIVIGGGAAGCFCAVNAAGMNRNLRVILLEKTSKLLSKVRISGGGRCNVTHALFDIPEMSRRYPRGQNFIKKTFHQFFTTDTINWFKERGVSLKTEADGRMFPVSDSSTSIVDCLVSEMNRHHVMVRMNADVHSISPRDGKFSIHVNSEELTADYVCVACGGFPKPHQFQWLQALGHRFANPVPSLFTFNLPKHPITELMGVSVEKVRIKIEGSKLSEEGPILITHWGLSGPAVLRLSAWGARELSEKNYSFRIHINWMPRTTEIEFRQVLQESRKLNPGRKVINHNMDALPGRLTKFLLEQSGVQPDLRFSDLPSRIENALIKNLFDYTADVKGKTTFKEEFVTAGGIELNEVDPNTMMSKKQPGIFFAGEILDVDGITGGFNFQHAWTSGWIAAKSISELSSLANRAESF